jgi:predicted HTH transcriptional regulator
MNSLPALSPVLGTTLQHLDRDRLENYFYTILQPDCPPVEDDEAWIRLLLNVDILVEDHGRAIPTVGGLLLFGENPTRHLPQSGITATAYPGQDKEYATVDEDLIRGPLRWSQHFAWTEDTMLIIGRTATGRATVEALQLNRTELLNLRRVLRVAGEHPPVVPD